MKPSREQVKKVSTIVQCLKIVQLIDPQFRAKLSEILNYMYMVREKNLTIWSASITFHILTLVISHANQAIPYVSLHFVFLLSCHDIYTLSVCNLFVFLNLSTIPMRWRFDIKFMILCDIIQNETLNNNVKNVNNIVHHSSQIRSMLFVGLWRIQSHI